MPCVEPGPLRGDAAAWSADGRLRGGQQKARARSPTGRQTREGPRRASVSAGDLTRERATYTSVSPFRSCRAEPWRAWRPLLLRGMLRCVDSTGRAREGGRSGRASETVRCSLRETVALEVDVAHVKTSVMRI